MNLMMLLEMANSGFGDRVAFVNGNDSLTYSELFAAAGTAAAQVKVDVTVSPASTAPRVVWSNRVAEPSR